MDDIQKLRLILKEAKRIVFFTGAGVSTESKIPDFRSDSGLYNKQQKKYGYPAEYMLSHNCFVKHTKEFYNFYFNEMIYKDAKPNLAHIWMSKLEKEGKCIGVITQNIDGLHQKAGSNNVIELHGSVYRNHCLKCNKSYSLDDIINKGYICSCTGIIKPDVVLYEEGLDNDAIYKSLTLLETADVLIVAGTSLSVYPASSLIQYFKGKYSVLINMQTTSLDKFFDLIIHDKVGKVLDEALKGEEK